MGLEKLANKLFSTVVIGFSALTITNCYNDTKLIKNYEPPKPTVQVIEKCPDKDGDFFYGKSGCGTYVDCDDNNANIWQIQDFYTDNDNDNYGTGELKKLCAGWTPENYSRKNGDCDDSNQKINPSEKEWCDNLDNDCDPNTLDGSYEIQLNSNQNGVCKYSLQDCFNGELIENYSKIQGYEEKEIECKQKDTDCDGTVGEGCGRIIMGTVNDTKSAISIIRWDGEDHTTIITSTSAVIFDPDFSPDGNEIVFSKYSGYPNNMAMYVYNLSTARTRRISQSTNFSRTTAHSADWCNSGELFFVRNYFLMKLDPQIGESSEAAIIEPKPFSSIIQPLRYNPKCSPNSQSLAYTRITERNDLNNLNNSKFSIATIPIINTNGINEKIISENWDDSTIGTVRNRENYFTQAIWHPNGQVMIVSAQMDTASGNNELYVVDLEGNVKNRLTHDNEIFSNLQRGGNFIEKSPCISENGSFLAYISNKTGNSEIYRMKLVDNGRTIVNGGIEQLTFGFNVANINCR